MDPRYTCQSFAHWDDCLYVFFQGHRWAGLQRSSKPFSAYAHPWIKFKLFPPLSVGHRDPPYTVMSWGQEMEYGGLGVCWSILFASSWPYPCSILNVPLPSSSEFLLGPLEVIWLSGSNRTGLRVVTLISHVYMSSLPGLSGTPEPLIQQCILFYCRWHGLTQESLWLSTNSTWPLYHHTITSNIIVSLGCMIWEAPLICYVTLSCSEPPLKVGSLVN